MNAVTESALRSQYIASLLRKMVSICDLWSTATLINKSDISYIELFYLVHNLYASSSMHGLPALASTAKKLEKTLDNHTIVKTDVVDCLGQLSKEIWLAQKLLPRDQNNNE